MPARRTAPLAAAIAATALLAAPAADAQAPAPAPARTVTAIAAGRVTVNRSVAQNNRALAAAVDAARANGSPPAIAHAPEGAHRAPAGAGPDPRPAPGARRRRGRGSASAPEPGRFFGGPAGAPSGAEGTFGP